MGAVLVGAACGSGSEPGPSAEPTAAPSRSEGTAAPESPCPQLAPACEVEISDEPQFSDPVQVVPSDQMPDDVRSQGAHNNLDVAWHDGRLYLAFRTAPNHFASADAVLYVVSSDDLETWRFEGHFALGTDVREPQLLSMDGDLRIYFAELGTNPLAFEPAGTWTATYRRPGRWSDPEPVFAEDFIPWRIKPDDGRASVIGYTGGANIYDQRGDITVHWLASDDGVDWAPAFEGAEALLVGGASETDWVTAEDGEIVAVSRNEAGEGDEYGSKVCTAPADDPGDWTCRYDRRKFDSPLVFTHGDEVYLIARRSLGGNGDYDLRRNDLDADDRFVTYQAAYSTSPKRCSLWRVDPIDRAVAHVVDLPSAGDTCFAELVRLDAHRYLVFNYTSPLEGADPTWLEGQLGPTSIYWTVLTLR